MAGAGHTLLRARYQTGRPYMSRPGRSARSACLPARGLAWTGLAWTGLAQCSRAWARSTLAMSQSSEVQRSSSKSVSA